MPEFDRISDFIAALQDEIDAVKKAKLVAIDLADGVLIAQSRQKYHYVFTAANLFDAEEDSIANIEIGGQNFDCSVASVSGFKVNVILPQMFGASINAAKLTPNRWLTLHRLQEKFREAKSHSPNPPAFKLAEAVFSGTGTHFGAVGTKAKYSYEAKNAPDFSQSEAITKSFSHSLAIICGPPGSGKTTTLARIVEAHVNAGRRVLMISHSNATTDLAIKQVATQLNKTAYPQSKIIRLGDIRDGALQQQYPLVELEQVVAASCVHLLAEQQAIAARQKPLNENLTRCQSLQRVGELVKNLERETQRPEKMIMQQERYQQITSEIAETQAKLQAAHQYLDPHVRATHIHDLTQRLSTLSRHQSEIAINWQKLSEECAAQVVELGRANQELTQLMDETGLTPGDVGEYIDVAETKLQHHDQSLIAIEKEIAAAAQIAVSGAQVIGITISKLFLSTLLKDEIFDIIVINEASLIPLPHLYWALTKATIGATLVGDFNQRPLAAGAESAMAQKWLNSSIFDHLKINTVATAAQHKFVSLLDTQYGMAPEIAAAASVLFYGGLLKSDETTYQIAIDDSIFAAARMVIVDTSAVDPWCLSPATGGRFNLYSAGLAINLCKRLLNEHAHITIGITTPYRQQAELTGRAINQTIDQDRVSVDITQGCETRQSTVIILDCVDGKGSKKSMLDEKPTLPHLLHSALTRAQATFIIVVNLKYFAETQKGTIFMKFLAQLAAAGAVKIDSRKVDDSFIAKAIETADSRDFFKAFRRDLTAAQTSAVLLSPFLTIKRSQYFFDQFRTMVAQGTRITVYTRPAAEFQQEQEMRESSAVIEQLKSIGVTVKERSNLQQKVALIDERICWEGSLNILGHGNSLEHMRRIDASAVVTEVRRSLSL